MPINASPHVLQAIEGISFTFYDLFSPPYFADFNKKVKKKENFENCLGNIWEMLS
jgi:hypothetical protein